MADAKHTQGEWVLRGTTIEMKDGAQLEIAEILTDDEVDDRGELFGSALADANLIVAAQDLLAALKTLVDRDLAYESGFVVRGLIRVQDVQAARRAIAKATGSAS